MKRTALSLWFAASVFASTAPLQPVFSTESLELDKRIAFDTKAQLEKYKTIRNFFVQKEYWEKILPKIMLTDLKNKTKYFTENVKEAKHLRRVFKYNTVLQRSYLGKLINSQLFTQELKIDDIIDESSDSNIITAFLEKYKKNMGPVFREAYVTFLYLNRVMIKMSMIKEKTQMIPSNAFLSQAVTMIDELLTELKSKNIVFDTKMGFNGSKIEDLKSILEETIKKMNESKEELSECSKELLVLLNFTESMLQVPKFYSAVCSLDKPIRESLFNVLACLGVVRSRINIAVAFQKQQEPALVLEQLQEGIVQLLLFSFYRSETSKATESEKMDLYKTMHIDIIHEYGHVDITDEEVLKICNKYEEPKKEEWYKSVGGFVKMAVNVIQPEKKELIEGVLKEDFEQIKKRNLAMLEHLEDEFSVETEYVQKPDTDLFKQKKYFFLLSYTKLLRLYEEDLKINHLNLEKMLKDKKLTKELQEITAIFKYIRFKELPMTSFSNLPFGDLTDFEKTIEDAKRGEFSNMNTLTKFAINDVFKQIDLLLNKDNTQIADLVGVTPAEHSTDILQVSLVFLIIVNSVLFTIYFYNKKGSETLE